MINSDQIYNFVLSGRDWPGDDVGGQSDREGGGGEELDRGGCGLKVKVKRKLRNW